MESLTEFIRSNPDPRELKRALAVKMVKQNYSYYQIRDTLGVSLGFISTYQQKSNPRKDPDLVKEKK